MVKLPRGGRCPTTTDLRSKAFDGRHDQARREAIELLREGFVSRPFLHFVADLLEPKKRERGQPSRPPARWLEIGERFELEIEAGSKSSRAKRNRAMQKLAKEFNTSASTIGRAVDIYEEAKKESERPNSKSDSDESK